MKKIKYITKNDGFTLVELIVVITILAILGTIAFIALQGYSAQSRDSVRISDMGRMKTGLELFKLESGKYPIPTDGDEVTFSGDVLVWTQGYFGEEVYTNVDRLDKIPKDPQTDLQYVYSTTNTRQEFQLAGVMEGDEITVDSGKLVVGKILASTKIARLKITGNYNGKLMKVKKSSIDYILALPSIMTSNGTELETIIANKTLAYNGYKNLPTQFSSNYKTDGEKNLNLVNTGSYVVFSGSLSDLSQTNKKEELITNLKDAYEGTDIETVGEIAEIINIEDTDTKQIETLANAIVSNNLGGSVDVSSSSSSSSGGGETYSCDETSKPADNGNITYVTGTPTETNQTYVQDASNCGYSCINGYTGTNCDIEPILITSTDCTTAGWIWVSETQDVYIGTNRGNGFCISPRFGDWNSDSSNGDGGISWNGWGNHSDSYRQGWNASSIDDTGNPYPEYGQTRILEGADGTSDVTTYGCKTLGTASSDYDISDTIVGRMKWLATTGNNYAQAQSIDWITGITPVNGHAIPALFIADCIDGVKDLGTTMTYIHNNDTTDEVTYAKYSTNVTLNTDTAYLSNTTYQNRQKYLTAWTQKSGSHLPSAFSYISTGTPGGCESTSCDNLTGNARGQYQVACDQGLLTDANDDTDNERIWLSAIGSTTGSHWGRFARIVGYNGCGDQESSGTGLRGSTLSARFVVRP